MTALSILMILLGTVCGVITGIYYFSSIVTYQDGEYIGIESNKDYLVLFIVSMIVLALGIYCLVKYLTKKEEKYGTALLVLSASSLIVFIHNLAAMIKIIVKNVIKGKNDPFIGYLWYIIPAFILTIVFIYLLVAYKKKTKEDKKEL